MNAIKQKSREDKWLLGLAAALTLVQLFGLFGGFTLSGLLLMLTAGVLSWLLLRGGKEKLFCLALLAVGAAGLVAFFEGFGLHWYAVSHSRFEGMGMNWRGSVLLALPGLCRLLGLLGLSVLGAALYSDRLAARRELIRKYWYLPALLLGASFGLALLLRVGLFFIRRRSLWPGFSQFAGLSTLLWGALAAFYGMRLSGHKLPERGAVCSPKRAGGSSYRNPALLLFLSLITCGVWFFVWVWRATAVLADYEDRRPRKPLHELLFCLFLPLYLPYWFYKTAGLAAQAADGEKNERFAVLCLLLGIGLQPLAMLLVQEKLNILAEREDGIEVELTAEEPVSAPVPEEIPHTEPVEPESAPAPRTVPIWQAPEEEPVRPADIPATEPLEQTPPVPQTEAPDRDKAGEAEALPVTEAVEATPAFAGFERMGSTAQLEPPIFDGAPAEPMPPEEPEAAEPETPAEAEPEQEEHPPEEPEV